MPLNIFLVFSAIFLLIGVIFVILGINVMNQAQNWPTINGVIIQSSMTIVNGRYGGYAPDIRFSYAINGTNYSAGSYSGTTILTNDQAGVQDILNRYPVGASVKAYYNPNNPAQAYLQPGIDSNSQFLLLIGAILIVVAVLIWWIQRKGHAFRSKQTTPQVQP